MVLWRSLYKGVLIFNSLQVKIHSLLLNFNSLLLIFNSLLLIFNSLQVKIHSLLLNFNSLLLNFNSLLPTSPVSPLGVHVMGAQRGGGVRETGPNDPPPPPHASQFSPAPAPWTA